MRKREIALAVVGSDDSQEKDSQFVTALARGLDVLRAFRPGDPPLGNQELAYRTRLPKATVSRLTYTLSSLGYLNYSGHYAKYTLSVRALALGFTALGHLGIRDVARPHMQALANETGVSVALGARDGTTMVYIEHCRGSSPLHIGIEVGSHINLARSAMGRAYLAGLPHAEQTALLSHLALKDSWQQARPGLEEALANVSRVGFALSIGEWKPEVNAVGAPLVLGGGSLAFALNCGGPAILLSRAVLVERYGPALVGIARAIRREMGFS